jgi:hypothetical protein
VSYRTNYHLIDWSADLAPVRKPQTEPARSALPFPRVISDVMDPVQSMLDGKYYTSKSALRATYKQGGVVEVGNDPQRFAKRKKAKPNLKQIKTTLEKAEAKFNNGERVNRHKIAAA